MNNCNKNMTEIDDEKHLSEIPDETQAFDADSSLESSSDITTAPSSLRDALQNHQRSFDTESDGFHAYKKKAKFGNPKEHLTSSSSSKGVKCEDDTVTSRPKRAFTPFINYEIVIWILFLTVATLGIIDRFAWNVWPRQLFNVGSGTAGNDRTNGLKEGPWSVQVYDAMARISGRFSIVSLNLLFYTMMRTTTAWLAETWIAQRVIDFSNHEDANHRIHMLNGIALIVLTLSHVWTIIFPCIVSGWSAKVVPGVFEWPLSERTPSGFKDVDVLTKTMSLQVDDVFRIILMTTMLAILLPLTVRWFQTRWHIGIQIHSMIAVIYFIDIVRRHSHPHSWILNTPFFVAWLLDHVAGALWRRRKPTIYRRKLSDDYMVLFWNQDVTSNTVSPKYYMKHRDSSATERAHVFTATENRLGADMAEGREWTTCLVVRVYHSTRNVRLPKQDKSSHTEYLAEANDLDVYTWGPFHGAMSERVRFDVENELGNVVLVGGGSAAGFVLDGLQHHLAVRGEMLTVMYTARDVGVFNWILESICALRERVSFDSVSVIIAVTDGGSEEGADILDRAVEEGQDQVAQTFDETAITDQGKEQGKCSFVVQKGRIQFADSIEAGNKVFFEGSGGLQMAVQKACKSKGAKLVAGPVFDGDRQKGKGKPKSLRMNCFAARDVTV